MEYVLKPNEFNEIRSGIYFLCQDKKVVYIGQSKDVATRVAAHTSSKEFDSVTAMLVPEELLDETEQYWIKRIKPNLNVRYLVRAEKRPPRTKPYSITVPKTLLPVIHRMASESGRSVSGYLSHLIRQDTKTPIPHG
jgi:predicted GIY-YIG superfamily endonuclease